MVKAKPSEKPTTKYAGQGLTPMQEVEALLGDLSQGIWAASWLQGLEHTVWNLLLHGIADDDLCPYYDGVSEARADLRRLRDLTVDQGWWPVFDEDEWAEIARDLPGLYYPQLPLRLWDERQPEGKRSADLPPKGAQ